MKKVILEEIENMKYLLGYKRGVVISEQITDKELDNLPSETTSSTPPVAAAPVTDTTTAAPVTDTTPNPTVKMGVINPRVQYLQQLLNDKFQSGLVADGKYGPKTANAIYKNIIAISKTQLTPVQQVNKTAEVVTAPVAAPVANATIPQQ